jgi:hypothetical protein
LHGVSIHVSRLVPIIRLVLVIPPSKSPSHHDRSGLAIS